MRSSYSTPVKVGTPSQPRTPSTPVVPSLSALSRGLTPSFSPRTKIHKLLPFSPTAIGGKPQGIRPRTGGPKAKWIDVESGRPHTARDADKSLLLTPEESRRPHTSRYESKHCEMGTSTAPEPSESLQVSVDCHHGHPHAHHDSYSGVAVLSGMKGVDRKVFSKVAVPQIASIVTQEALEANNATFAAVREHKLKLDPKPPSRAWPLHVEPTKKLYSALPLEHTLPVVFGDAKPEEEWGDDEVETLQFEEAAGKRRGAAGLRKEEHRSEKPMGGGGKHVLTPEKRPATHSLLSAAVQDTSFAGHQSAFMPAFLSRPAPGQGRGPSGEFLQRGTAFRSGSSGSISSLSVPSQAASAPAAMQIVAPEHLEPDRVHNVLRGLPLVCDGRVRVSTDFSKILLKKEKDLKGRVVAALQKKAEEAKYRKHIVAENSRTAWSTPTMSMESLNNWHAVRELRMHHAVKKKKALDDAKQQYKEQALEWKVTYSERLKVAEARSREAEDQRFLFASVILAARAKKMIHNMVLHRQIRAEQHRKSWAVACIAKKFRERLLYNYKKRYRQAILALAIRFASAIQRWRARAKRKKAHIIITFLQEVTNSAKLQVALKRYRNKIVRCQKFARQYIQCNRARYLLLELQWDQVDEARIRSFIRNRAEQLHHLKRALTPSMRLGGSQLEAMNSKMRLIAAIGGPKTLRQCQTELEQARNKYLELFLGADLRDVPKISPIIKKKMLIMYVKKIRMQYTQEYILYRKRLDNWNSMQQTHHSLSLVASSMISDMEGTKGETYLKNRLKEVLDLDMPRPPTFNMVLKRETMQQIVLKAVEHTRRLEAKQHAQERAAAAGRGQGILRPNGNQSNIEKSGEWKMEEDEEPAPKTKFRTKRMEGLLKRLGTHKDVLMID